MSDQILLPSLSILAMYPLSLPLLCRDIVNPPISKSSELSITSIEVMSVGDNSMPPKFTFFSVTFHSGPP